MPMNNDLIQVLNDFQDIIQDYEIKNGSDSVNRNAIYTKIWLRNTSKLLAKDIVLLLNRQVIGRKYSYQWMDAENQLIIRWDNVPHYPQLPNAPFHRHVGTDENVETSPEITLREVLVFIRSKIMEI